MQLNIKNLLAGYDEKIILQNISFTFRSGLTILTGANGVGKTTLLRVCAGVISPGAGSLSYEDEAEVRLNIGPAVAYVPHRPVYYSRLTGRQHIHYWALVYNVDQNIAKRRAEVLGKALGMESFIDEKSDTYSRGQLQRLCLLQCLLSEPDVVFLDEPVSGVDPESKEKIITLLTEYANERGRIVVATSHEGDELNAQADYIVKMEKDNMHFQKTK